MKRKKFESSRVSKKFQFFSDPKMDSPKTTLSKKELELALLYFDNEDDVANFAKASNKTAEVAHIHRYKKIKKIKEEVEAAKKLCSPNEIKRCFKKDGTLVSPNTRGITRNTARLLTLLHKLNEYENVTLSNNANDVKKTMNELTTFMKQHQPVKRKPENTDYIPQKKIEDIKHDKMYIDSEEFIKAYYEDGSLTEQIIDMFCGNLKLLEKKYSESAVIEAQIDLKGKWMSKIKQPEQETPEPEPEQPQQQEAINDFTEFNDLNPHSIDGVQFDLENGIIKANLMKNRYDRLMQIRDHLGEMLDRPNQDYIYRYYFHGLGWRNFRLHGSEALKRLIDSIEGSGLYNRYEMTEDVMSTFYNPNDIPEPEFIDALWIGPERNTIVTDGLPEKQTIGGEFYPYAILPQIYDMEEEFLIGQVTTGLSKPSENGKSTYRDIYELNCFCYALKQAKVPTELLEQVKMHCLNRYQTASRLDELCKSVNLCVKITREDKTKDKNKTRVSYIGAPLNDHKYYVKMAILREPGMIGDHYIYNSETRITSFHLKHRQEMVEWALDHEKDIKSMWNKERFNKKKNCYQVKDGKHFVTRFELFLWARDNGFLRPYTMNETLILPTNLYSYVSKEITTLNYDDYSLRSIKEKVSKKKSKKSNEITKYYYADFEASTQGFHQPYCVSYSSRDETEIHTIWGSDCAFELLSKLENNSLTYFHNLAYDGRFLAKYGIKQAIKKGGKLLSFKISFKGKNLQFRDSWAMISSKLSDFPSMFNIKDISKELYPYNYYTQERVKQNVGVIDEAGKYECVPWNEKEYSSFVENIDKIPSCRIDDNHFDMELYCKFYCEQDVKILKIGHTTFRELCLKELNLDIDYSISISSLANKYFEQNVYSKIDDLYEYSGVVREYIQGCVKGGRCMTRQNKKWHCTERLYDYDACSLYPSAVHRLKLSTGKPNVIPDEWCGESRYLLDHLMDEQQLVPSENKFISSFIVDIVITKIGKELAFPIIMKKTKNGNLNCNECCEMRVDNIELEDLIKFQEIEFIIKRGYYWTGAKSDLFSNEMKRIYDLRVAYKKEKNPLQLVLKLLMNSTYGKTIQKPIKNELVYKLVHKTQKNGKTYDAAARYNKKNAALIKEYYHISKDIICFDVHKNFDEFYVPNLIGVQILSMSKRIMNEVMCLAEDLNIMIYYQDTDSMHIPVKDVPRLEESYHEKYGRVLRGSDMGQFHPDFESDKLKGDIQSVESYFLGKKAYCDKLVGDNDDFDFHLRLKGIPNNLLESEYENPLDLYKFMYEGGAYKFNLLKLRPSFEMTKDMKIKTRTEFNRKIQFDG